VPRTRRKPETSYHHGDLAAAIGEVASSIVSSEGPLTLTVRSVAERLGVSHAAIYHHFKDRTDILAAVAERGFERLGQAMDRAMDEVEGALLRYKAQGLCYVRFAVRNPRLYGVMFGPEAALRREYPGLAAAAQRVLERIRVAVVACQDEGLLTAGTPDQHALFCWSAVHGLASLIVGRQVEDLKVPASAEALAELVADRIFLGLGTRPG
jgi:AcrR family transcriptional regulator